jgi:hypothetical protein
MFQLDVHIVNNMVVVTRWGCDFPGKSTRIYTIANPAAFFKISPSSPLAKLVNSIVVKVRIPLLFATAYAKVGNINGIDINAHISPRTRVKDCTTSPS